MNAYRDDWEGKDWSAVAEDFSEYSGRERAATLIPEPEQVILAAYTYEDYSGDAWVVYRQGTKFYEVNGGHCSCYGLEGQFDPEEYADAQTFLAVLERRNEAYGLAGQYRAEVIADVRDFARAP